MAHTVIEHPGRRRQPAAALLSRIEAMVADACAPRVDALLRALDDELFARADAAVSDAVQQQYFDAMRVLRFERETLRDRFLRALATPAPEETGTGGGFRERIGALTLLADEALEQRLAVTTMSHRVERELDLSLTLLGVRVRALLDEPGATREPPWTPRHVAEAWARALGPLELGAEVRLVLFKHFEHAVLRPLAEVVDAVNEFLVAAAVLPDLSLADAMTSRRERKARRSDRSPDPQGPTDARSGTGSESTTAAGRSRPGAPASPRAPASPDRRGDAGDGPRGPAGPDSATPGAASTQAARHLLGELPGLGRRRRLSTGSGVPLGERPLHAGVAAAQRRWMARWTDRSLDEIPERLDLADGLVRHAGTQGRTPCLAVHDEDIVNLLQGLFDELLRDENLPVPVRSLVARIQFPLLRVALAEPAFLVDARHPARRFLDLVTRVGIGWVRADDRAQDRMYTAIEHAVDRIAAAGELGASLFRALETELRDALEAEADAVRRASERIVAQERARIAAERTRRLVERLVAHRVAAVADSTVARFLGSDWQQVMLRVHQQDGPESRAWRAAFTVLRRLSGGRGPDGAALHAALVVGLRRLGRGADVAEADATRVMSAWVASGTEWDPQQPRPEPARVVPAPEPVERLPSRHAIDAANALECGDWVELTQRTGRVARCRLASITDAPERCIFVNRRGVRIETLSRLELAAAIEGGRLRQLDSEHLFDSALERVIESMRSAA